MQFRPRCPKCGSLNISVEKAGGWSNPEPVLRCTCGTVLYGEKAIRALYAEQETAWKATRKERAVEDAERAAAKAKANHVAQVADAQHRQSRLDKLRREDEDREAARLANVKWAADMAQKRKDAPPPPEVTFPPGASSPALSTPAISQITVGHHPPCMWKDCGNSSRPTSKYCSTACKNKNARWRYKQRHGNSRGKPTTP